MDTLWRIAEMVAVAALAIAAIVGLVYFVTSEDRRHREEQRPLPFNEIALEYVKLFHGRAYRSVVHRTPWHRVIPEPVPLAEGMERIATYWWGQYLTQRRPEMLTFTLVGLQHSSDACTKAFVEEHRAQLATEFARLRPHEQDGYPRVTSVLWGQQ